MIKITCKRCKRLESDIISLVKAIQEMEDALEDVLNQACSYTDRDNNSHIDSCAISAYANGLRLMVERERFEIEREHGRRVIGKWKER